jgi:predicted RND superfamily exporter protein
MFARLLDAVSTFPTRRPWAVVGAAIALTAVSLAGAFRMPLSATLETMLDPRRPAVAAMRSVLDEFDTAGDLRLLASLPESAEGGTPESIARLTGFANRLERAIRGSPALSAMCPRVLRRLDPDAAEFVKREMVPAGAYYLDDAEFAAFLRRLTRAEMAEQLRRNETLIAAGGPAGAALSRTLLQDPLRLREFLTERLWAERGGFATFDGGPDFLSPDGRHILILLRGAKPSSDIRFAREFTAAVRSAVDSFDADGLTVALSGGHAIAAEAERRIKADSIANIGSSLLLMQVLFWSAYRRVWSFALAAVPLIAGIIWGFGVYSLISPALTPLTAVIGSVLAGLGDDFAVHWLSHYSNHRSAGRSAEESAQRTSRELAPALFSAWGTSALGFAVIALSDVRALRDFALVGALGITGTFVASMTLGPALVMLTLGRSASPASFERRFGLSRLTGCAERRGRLLMAGFIAAAVALAAVPALMPDRAVAFDPDLTSMHPEPNAPLATQRRIAELFGGSPDVLLIHVRAETPAALAAAAHRVQAALSAEIVRSAGLSAAVGPALFVPDPGRIGKRRVELNAVDVDRVIAEFRAALEDSPFNPAAYAGYEKFLRGLLSAERPPELSDLVRYPGLSDRLLPRAAFEPAAAAPTQALISAATRRPPQDRAERDAILSAVRTALAGIPEATPTGATVIAADTEAGIRRDLAVLLLAAGAVNLTWLGLHLRRAADVVPAALPAAAGLLGAWAGLCVSGERWNLANLMVFPLLIGAGVDYGIFLVCLFRDGRERDVEELRREIAAGVHALITMNATTVIGFGTLYWTSTPAVRSFGLLTGIGFLAALAAALLFVLPLLISRDRRFGNGREKTGASA